MANLSEELNTLDTSRLGDAQPTKMLMSDVVNVYSDKIKNPMQGVGSDFWGTVKTGLKTGIKNVLDLPESLAVFGGEAYISIGDMLGNENMVKRGQAFISSVQGELDAEAAENLKYMTKEDMDTWAFKISSNLPQYATMIGTGLLGGAKAAIGVGSAIEVSGETQEGLPRKETGELDVEKITPDFVNKELVSNTAYAVGSGFLESRIGIGKQLSYKVPFKYGKKYQQFAIRGGLGAISEGSTEYLQAGLSSVIDVANGTLDIGKLPDELKKNIDDGVIGAVLGGAGGFAMAIGNRNNFVKNFSKQYDVAIPNEKERVELAKEIYDSAIDDLSGVATTAITVSEQLKNGHGDVYNSMVAASKQAMIDSGGYSGLDESQIAQHASEVSRTFADQVIGESLKSNRPIQDIVDASQIVYENGELRLAEKPETKAEKLARQAILRKKVKPQSLLSYIVKMGGIKDEHGELSILDAVKGRPGLVNNKTGLTLDEVRERVEEAGYFGMQSKQELGTTSVADLLELIENELRGTKVYTDEGVAQVVEQQKEDLSEAEYYIEKILDENNVNYEGLTFDEKREIASKIQDYDTQQQMQPVEQLMGDEDIFEFFQIADRINEIDKQERLAGVPVYDKETININGVERSVRNSEGNKIAESEKSLRMFYEWFGDSKVVDEQGRPLVVYHGTRSKRYGRELPEFDVFSRDKLRSLQNRVGFFFGETESFAKAFGDRVMPVYLKMNNPKIYKKGTPTSEELALEQGEVDKATGDDKYYAQKILNDSRKYTDAYDKFVMDIYHKSGKIPYQNRKDGNFNDAVYLGSEESFDIADTYTEKLQKDGFDGVIILNTEVDANSNQGKPNTQYVAFSPNQIKSVNNRGTFSESENIYYQSAFAGSRVDYDRPSLEAIGSGEGHAAHGWGLYYALSKDVAEKYRKTFSRQSGYKYNGKELKYLQFGKYNAASGKRRALQDIIVKSTGQEAGEEFADIVKELKDKYKQTIEDSRDYDSDFWQRERKIAEENLKGIEQIDFSKLEKVNKGQVHEVDIPESPYLLDEQKPFSEQSDYVKERLEKIFSNLPEKYLENYPKMGLERVKELDFSGSEIYGALEEAYGSQKEASKTLEKYGIKGITYFGQQDGRAFVIFNPEDVRVIRKFYQITGLEGAKPIRKGSYDAKSKVIKLFEDADTSTLPHELAHFWLDNMWTYANSGFASPEYITQFNGVMRFLDLAPNQDMKLLPASRLRKAHEKFASAYEKYVWRGEFPTPIMGKVFGNYERWLRDVYNSINDITISGTKSKVRLTPEIISFFDSMLTGGIPTMPQDMQVAVQKVQTEEAQLFDEKHTEQVREFVKEKSQMVESVEPAPVGEIKPVLPEGKVKESSLYKRMKGIVGATDVLEYEKANIAEQREKAKEMWAKNPQKARDIISGVEVAEDVLRNALFTEQQRIALENGDVSTYLKSLRKQSAEATRMGQELSALRGVIEDITMPAYWIRMAEYEAQKQLSKKMATYFDNVMGRSNMVNFTSELDADIKRLYNEVSSKETADEKSKALKDGINELKKKYKGLEQNDALTFYQTEWTNEELAYDYIEKQVKDAIGINLSQKEVNAIIQASRDLDTLSRDVDEFGIPKEAFFIKKAELESMVNSHTPTAQTKVLLSTVGRANMLTAPATSVLNVSTNLQNYYTQSLIRSINNKLNNHTNDNLIDDDIVKNYRKKVWDTFWKTGYDISMMETVSDKRLYKGEQISHSEGEGAIRQMGRWAEQYVFRDIISSPDVYFKSMKAFTEFAGNEATDIAYKEGLTGDSAKQRANQLFLDAIKIEPKTEVGKYIRKKAQTDALVITFQNNTKLAEVLLDLRNLINRATGDIGVGDLISAFVKTPANVLSLSFDAAVGPFANPKNLIGAINDIKNKQINSERVQMALRQTTTSVVANTLVAFMLMSFIDDEDYIPDYAQLTPNERAAIQEMGGTFGSVRIGDMYVSTEYFGIYELPLVSILNARRMDGFDKAFTSYTGSLIRKFLDAPVIKEFAEQGASLNRIGSDSLSIQEYIYDEAGNILTSRIVPNIINTTAKVLDEYERNTNKDVIKKLQAKIPLLREQLQEKISYTTGEPIKTQDALVQILFGSRGKEVVGGALAQELFRLYQEQNAATLTDITRSGDLKNIPDEYKQQVIVDFASEYAQKALTVISSSSYAKKSDEDKKEALNKVRRDVVKKLKRKYKKQIEIGKQLD